MSEKPTYEELRVAHETLAITNFKIEEDNTQLRDKITTLKQDLNMTMTEARTLERVIDKLLKLLERPCGGY